MHSARRAASSSFPSPIRQSRIGKWWRENPLGRDIAVILVVKALVLCALWFAFFRAPVARHMTMDPKAVELQVAGTGQPSEAPHAER